MYAMAINLFRTGFNIRRRDGNCKKVQSGVKAKIFDIAK
jgi:hypothetical protein